MSSTWTAVAFATLLTVLLCPSFAIAQRRDDPLQFHNDALWKSIHMPPPDALEPGEPIIVAVLDGPVRTDHEDLANVVFVQPRPRDPDGHCAAMDCCPQAIPPAASWHATRVAGVIGATRGNGVGTAGIAPVRAIVSINTTIGGAEGEASLARAIHCAIEYRDATGRRARLANISLGSVQRLATTALTTALSRARDEDLLIVTSAGNDGKNIDTLLRWPGSQNLPNIITVETRRYDGGAARGASFGFGTVDLGAPAPMAHEKEGHSLCAPSTPLRSRASCSGEYGSFEQSSAATAVVSGAAALIWSDRRYAGCSAAQMRNLLLTSRSHCRRGYSVSERREAEVCLLDLAFLSRTGAPPNACEADRDVAPNEQSATSGEARLPNRTR
jgi:subtilisin family serine protease